MSFSSFTTEPELHSYFVKGEYVDGATEYPLTYSEYHEYEGSFLFYGETTYSFVGEDGEEFQWDTEDEALETLKALGYSNDY